MFVFVCIISMFIILKCTDCVPQCKFGICNTTIGECICPARRTGADCSFISMLILNVLCILVYVCVPYISISLILHLVSLFTLIEILSSSHDIPMHRLCTTV